ncbi:MAG: CoA transferase [Gammaproteobacteria bacterium]|nr:MAG: CoA transferase [Gammaproteobacteria bacterium]
MTALDGLRILDMTQYEAGTSCTQALAWLGADVVKVERPDGGDPGRGPDGDREYFFVWNSNKRSVAIDLRNAEGRALFMRMVPKYDVFVENYGPGVIERLGIGYEEMRAVKADIIYARIKGFGVDGSWSDYKCYDMVAQAAAGAFSITGEMEGPPMRPGPTMGDAWYRRANGTRHRGRLCAKTSDREGTTDRIVDAGGHDVLPPHGHVLGELWCTASESVGKWTAANHVAIRLGGGGANDYVYVMAVTEKMWQALCRVIDREELIRDSPIWFNKQIGTRTGTRCGQSLKPGPSPVINIKPCASSPRAAFLRVPSSTRATLYNNAHLVERGFIHEIEHPRLGAVKLLGWPVRMSESSVEIDAAPSLGQHSNEVLNDDLGLTQKELDDLSEQGGH